MKSEAVGRRARGTSQSLKAILGVRDLVMSGAFAPGERLSEPAIARQLGLSRTPVRAALARLEQEGLLEVIPSGGYSVRRFSVADVIDAIELRGVLEGTAARLAAERGLSPARFSAFGSLLSELDKIVAQPAGRFSYEAYIERNAEFHDMLKDACGSPLISREIERVTNLSFANPSAFLQAQITLPDFLGSLTVAQGQHRAIIGAIEMREGFRAEALAREHARLARDNLDFVLKNDRMIERVPALSLVSD